MARTMASPITTARTKPSHCATKPLARLIVDPIARLDRPHLDCRAFPKLRRAATLDFGVVEVAILSREPIAKPNHGGKNEL
jgi:hypothetical protein